MPRPTALDAARSFRSALANDEAQAAGRMATIYNRIYTGLKGEIAKLSVDIAAMEAPSRGAIMKLARMQSIQQQVKEQVTKFGGAVQNEVTIVQSQAVQAGIDNALTLIETSLPPLPDAVRGQLVASFARLPADAVEAAAGLTGQDSPLNERLSDLYGEYVAEQVGNHITDGIAKGDNPRTIARQLEKNVLSGLGSGLTSALTTVRTAQIKSYQLANHATYLANDNIVKGWVWHAELGSACFPAGTLITTKRGNVPIETVVNGDFVLTHTGKWQKVSEVMSRSYSGEMVTVKSSGVELTATKDHPLLIERQGQLNWVEISRLRIDDRLVCDVENLADIANHFGADITIKGSVGNTNNLVSPGLKPDGFLGVSVSDRFLTVPVDAIHFDNGIEIGQKEINGVSPTWESVFLNVVDTHIFKAKSNVLFRLSFPRKSSIAHWGAKLVNLGWLGKKFLAAGKASDMYLGFFSTFFRAMVDVDSGHPKDLITDGTHLKGFLTRNAALRTESPAPRFDVRGVLVKMLAARLADTFNFYRMLGQVCLSAIGSTIRPWVSPMAILYPNILAASDARSFDFPAFAFNGTGFYLSDHSSILTHNHNPVKLLDDVYNLEVEEDHSYFANGIAVHNCLACTSMHGSFHELDEVLAGHHSCRCSPIPQTISYQDLGLDIEETTEPTQTGEDWFNEQSAATQRELMGGPMHDAWKAGKVEFGQLSQPYDDAVYGQLLREASLKDILGEEAKEFYK